MSVTASKAIKILIVDDDPALRRVLRLALDGAGFRTAEAASDAEGLRRCDEIQPDLIISDLFMPEKGGIEMIKGLRKESPQLKIIVISGGCYVDPDPYLSMVKSLGVARILRKPFDQETLLEAIREVLAVSGAPQNEA